MLDAEEVVAGAADAGLDLVANVEAAAVRTEFIGIDKIVSKNLRYMCPCEAGVDDEAADDTQSSVI